MSSEDIHNQFRSDGSVAELRFSVYCEPGAQQEGWQGQGASTLLGAGTQGQKWDLGLVTSSWA